MFLENRIGSLEVGKEADIAIWDRDLYIVPTDQVKDLKCLMTIFEGEVVYTASDSPVSAASHHP
jgi:predicted amidohydrolase YtcJ